MNFQRWSGRQVGLGITLWMILSGVVIWQDVKRGVIHDSARSASGAQISAIMLPAPNMWLVFALLLPPLILWFAWRSSRKGKQ
jgi:hypothetical protein